MHPFPPVTSLNWLQGDQLGVITLGPFQITFKFESGGSIAVERALEVVDPSGNKFAYNPQDRTGGFTFEKLFMQRIKAVEREDDLTLSIGFEGGQTLTLRSELRPYECGMIFYPDGGWDVF